MARILALDTTSEFGGIAVIADGAVRAHVALHSPEGFAHVLFVEIEKVLSELAAQICDIDCFAAASGPGSFTGVRIGLTAVKGLAEACGKNVVAVSNLQALASLGDRDLRAVLLDARRGEVYGAVYDRDLRPIVDETVGKLDAWLASLPTEDVEFISSSPAILAPRPVRLAPNSLAIAVGLIAEREFLEGRALDPAAIDANYVRRSDAELFWKDQ